MEHKLAKVISWSNEKASNSDGYYKCGFITQIARICDTSRHLVDLCMHQLAKGKRPMGTSVKLTSLDITMISRRLKVPRRSLERGQPRACSAKGRSTT
jgi:hypothetical protein